MKLLTLSAILAATLTQAADLSPPVEQPLPSEKPVTAVIVAQCGAAVGIFATMPDGSLKAFDMRSPIAWAEQYAWASSAQSSVTVETKCNVLPEWLAPPPKVKS